MKKFILIYERFSTFDQFPFTNVTFHDSKEKAAGHYVYEKAHTLGHEEDIFTFVGIYEVSKRYTLDGSVT